MAIDYEAIQDIYPPQLTPGPKGATKFFCLNCKKTLDVKNFFKTYRTDKFANGILPYCKTCVTMGVEDTDESTFLPILKEIDMPYSPTAWRELVVKKTPHSPSILGKYISKMHLNQYKHKRWKDTKELVENESQNILSALRQQTETETEAEQKMEEIMSLSDLSTQPMNSMVSGDSRVPPSALYGLTPQTSKYDLTQEEINDLKIHWGADYSEDEYLQLEQLFTDMRQSYIIQDPIAISNARMICKMTIKMNKFLDIDDVESASKLSRQLDLYIKSANLAPVQQKDRQQSTFSISQLAFLIEKEGGFIPNFYKGQVNDKIDLLLEDMKRYTMMLVKGEPGLGDMIENAEAILAQDELQEEITDYNDFSLLESEILGDLEGDDVDAPADSETS